jgi:hypothetical protein
MPLIDDSDDEVEEFMVTSENLSEYDMFSVLSDHCTYCSRNIKPLPLIQGHSFKIFPIKYFYRNL